MFRRADLNHLNVSTKNITKLFLIRETQQVKWPKPKDLFRQLNEILDCNTIASKNTNILCTAKNKFAKSAATQDSINFLYERTR